MLSLSIKDLFSPLKKASDTFVEETQKVVEGEIGLKLYKGNIIITKRFSSNSLYKKNLATYGEKDSLECILSEGFIKLWSLPFCPLLSFFP